MCLIEPFIPQCCGRTYVKTSKVPSCPDAWPKAKCPPELCIQIGIAYPSNATCWRCKADEAGLQGWERVRMRPGIDKAWVVKGLDEIGVAGRRSRVEEGGHCWFCNARGGCETCGADEILPGEALEVYSSSSAMVMQTGDKKGKGKRKPEQGAGESGKRAGKRVKPEQMAQHQQSQQQQQQYSFAPYYGSGQSASNSTYPEPGDAGPSNWQQISTTYHTGNSGRPFAHDGLPRYTSYGESSNSSSNHGLSQYDPPNGEPNNYEGQGSSGHDGVGAGQAHIDPQLLSSTSSHDVQGEQVPMQDRHSPSTNFDPELESYEYKPQERGTLYGQGEYEYNDPSAPLTIDPRDLENNWEPQLGGYLYGYDPQCVNYDGQANEDN